MTKPSPRSTDTTAPSTNQAEGYDMNDNDRALRNLAWLAATLPTLAAQDFLGDHDVIDVNAGPYDVGIQLADLATTERVAARLGLSRRQPVATTEGTVHHVWKGFSGDVEVRLSCLRPVAEVVTA